MSFRMNVFFEWEIPMSERCYYLTMYIHENHNRDFAGKKRPSPKDGSK
jgi:hypothetical protein